MKAISLWQPWASAIAIGAKRIETRSWSTRYRGPIAIHAAKRTDELLEIFVHNRQLYEDLRSPFEAFEGQPIRDVFPLGAIVAVADLVGCYRTEDLVDEPDLWDEHANSSGKTWTEADWGNYGPGRFGWILENIRALPEPIPYRGRQGLFEVPDELVLGGLS